MKKKDVNRFDSLYENHLRSLACHSEGATRSGLMNIKIYYPIC